MFTNQEKIRFAERTGDQVEYYMTNPPRPMAVHSRENFAKKDYTKGIAFKDYLTVPLDWFVAKENPEIPNGWFQIDERELKKIGDHMWDGTAWVSILERNLTHWLLARTGDVYIRPLDATYPVTNLLRWTWALNKRLAALDEKGLMASYQKARGYSDSKTMELFEKEAARRGIKLS